MVSVRAATDLDLPLRLDRGSQRPLHRQIAAQLGDAIRAGQLPAGTRLPSTRRLASALAITRNVAVAAYADLIADGYLAGRHGSGTYVEATLPAFPRPALPTLTHLPRWLRAAPALPVAVVDTPSPPGAIDFRLGVPSLALLALDPWRRAWRDVVTGPPPPDYGSAAGLPALRAAIAGYLGRSRGLACGPDDVVITTGASHALALIARATLAPGDTVALEEPGYPTAHRVLRAHGARLLPVPVDDDGLRVDALPQGADAPLLVYATPSHHYPLGMRLSLARRLALLAWARAHDSLIVEDDYDSEFRFDAPPLPALAGLGADGCVAYIGTFSKVLTPALRVGYLVAPAPLRQRVEDLKRAADDHMPWPVEPALAAFIVDGHLDRLSGACVATTRRSARRWGRRWRRSRVWCKFVAWKPVCTRISTCTPPSTPGVSPSRRGGGTSSSRRSTPITSPLQTGAGLCWDMGVSICPMSCGAPASWRTLSSGRRRDGNVGHRRAAPIRTR